MHTPMHCIHTYINMHINMHIGYTYKYAYIRILLFNPYAAYFSHQYECEGNGMAQAPQRLLPDRQDTFNV